MLRPLRLPRVVEVKVELRNMSKTGSQFVISGVIRDGDGKEYSKYKATWVTLQPRGKL
jgi:hypothetical protein